MNVDNFKVAKDIAWVIKTMWGGIVVVVLATVWMTALAADVKSNADELKAREQATDAVPAIVAALARIEQQLDKADTRQRDIQKTVDVNATKIKALEEKPD